jgi:hypothetical protein
MYLCLDNVVIFSDALKMNLIIKFYPSHLKNELQGQKSNRKKKNNYPKNLKKTTAIDILYIMMSVSKWHLIKIHFHTWNVSYKFYALRC